MEKRILVVDDENIIRNILSQFLRDENYIVKSADNGIPALKLVHTFSPNLVILDQNMPGMKGMEVMEKIKDINHNIEVVIMTAYGDISMAVDAVKKGAYDFIEKPFDNEKILLLVDRVFTHIELNKENDSLKQELLDKKPHNNIIGMSRAMQQVFDQIECVCNTDATVLIQGESGVGKELVAQAIHNSGDRTEFPIVAVNCGAIPDQLIESELFGHEKGAFTDAKEKKIGKFELADKGTLFLDELGELSLDAQVKLLRVLEDRKVVRVGGKKSIPVDIRVIAATNNNLEEKVQKGEFRLDLLYRLNVFTIMVPPLRERKDDIPLLTEFFIKKYNKAYGNKISGVTSEAMDVLKNYSWPGNIRDLQNAIQSSIILTKEDTIGVENLPMRIKDVHESFNFNPDISLGLDENVKHISSNVEKELILDALKKCNFNKSETAKLLQISRKTLFNKMKAYGMQ